VSSLNFHLTHSHQAYGRAKAEFNFFSAVWGITRKMAEINYNVYAILWGAVGVFMTKYAPERFSGEITHSLLFFFFYNFVSTVIDLPLSYYHHFVMEEKFGFNKMTRKLWVMDKIKGQLLTIAFGTPVGAGVLAIIRYTGDSFFYWVWAFMFGVQLLAVTIYPIVIVPLFNKLTPLEDGPLKKAIDGLAGRLKFPLSELQVIDGSKRSSHSNAYFTGLPWKKKIVLFDTLIEQQSKEEVVAVLAHELGHWQLGHTTKLIAINSVHLFFIFSLFSAFVHNRQMFAEFGFEKQMPVIIGFFLFSEVLTPSECFLQFGMNSVTRKFEYQAGLYSPSRLPKSPVTNAFLDAFALQMGYKVELAQSLIKLQIKNLSSMDADHLYSSYHYSHPILPERLRALGWDGSEKVPETVPAKAAEGVAEKASGREL
jgi:STE24 endopeptidase